MKINNLKILKVFTNEYKNDCLYRNFMKKKVSSFKLKNNNYDVEEAVKLLKKRGFINNYNEIKES